MPVADRDTALTEVREVKLFLEDDEDVTRNDAHYANLIQQASGAISTYCDRKFAQETYTKYFDGEGTPHLYLPHWPITQPMASASGIWVDDNRVFGTNQKLEEDILNGTGAREYLIDRGGEEDGRGLIVRLGGVFQVGRTNIKAVWQGGYATIPVEIERICIELVATWWHLQKNRLHGQSSVTLPGGGGSITTYDHSDIPAHLKKRLDPWRRWRLM